MAIDFKELDAILAKASIVDVVGHYIPLTKKGSSYVAICPFHHDTNPSMQISPQKNIFKCFVCGSGGHSVNFVQKYEGCTYMQAVKKVCEICHLTLPSNFKSEEKRVRPNEEELQAVEKLAAFYHYMLRTNEGKKAYDYLVQRGLSDEVIDKFNLGYAPSDSTKAITYLREKEKIDVKVLDRAGIISASSAEFKDRYHDRVIFPLSDISGNIVGFSGRKYHEGGEEAKYINSPESVIFKKSALLYNFNNAASSIRKDRFVYVLEGFMDVIALYRAGITSAVGLMGTALTEDHISLFQKMNVEVRLSLDGDDPGQDATERSLRLLDGQGLQIQVVHPLLSGKDADELLKAEGEDSLRKAMDELELPLIHSLNYAVKKNLVKSYEDKEKFLRQERSYYLSAPSLARGDMLAALSQGLKVSPEAIRETLNSYSKQNFPAAKAPIQVTELEDEDLAGKEVNNSLFSYISPRLSDERMKELRNMCLVRTECQLLARMPVSVKALKCFEAEEDHFSIPAYAQAYGFLQEYYEDLRCGVEYVREEDYDDLVGLVEVYYQEQLEETEGRKITENVRQAVELKKKIVLGIISRLRYCANPSKSLDEGEFNTLIKRHKKQMLQLDMTSASLDPTEALALLKRSDALYKAPNK